jgi:hypothetical protein
MDVTGIPSESKTNGRVLQTCSIEYGSVAVPVALAPPSTRSVELDPDTVTVWGWGVPVDPAGVLAQAARAATRSNEKRRIRVREPRGWWGVGNTMHGGAAGVQASPKVVLRA